jgi:hypothetical protein
MKALNKERLTLSVWSILHHRMYTKVINISIIIEILSNKIIV